MCELYNFVLLFQNCYCWVFCIVIQILGSAYQSLQKKARMEGKGRKEGIPARILTGIVLKLWVNLRNTVIKILCLHIQIRYLDQNSSKTYF